MINDKYFQRIKTAYGFDILNCVTYKQGTVFQTLTLEGFVNTVLLGLLNHPIDTKIINNCISLVLT